MRKVAVTCLSLCLSLFAAQTRAQTVNGLLDKNMVKRGTMAKGKIILEIPDKLHVNSSIPENEFTIPTTVKLSGRGIRITKIKYPKGNDRKFEFSETPINVYENRTVIDFSFFVPRNFRGKTVRLRAVVGYQPCSIEVCYPPQRKTLNLTAAIK